MKALVTVLLLAAALIAASPKIQAENTPEQDRAEAATAKGEHLVGKKLFDKALLSFNEALKLYPGYALAYCGRGRAYLGKGQINQAIADFNKALELDPRLARAYFSRGLIYLDKGMFDRAIADLSKALRIKPKPALWDKPPFGDTWQTDAYYWRGYAYFKTGKKNQALTDLKMADDLEELGLFFREIRYRDENKYRNLK